MFQIYLIINTVNGKMYVGKTCQKLHKRWKMHTGKALRGLDTYLSNAIRKYGVGVFSINTLDFAYDGQAAGSLERRWIRILGTLPPDGYNLTGGGDGMSSPSEETRAKMSSAQKGKHHSPETRQKISKARTGTKQSSETVAKRSGPNNPMFGRFGESHPTYKARLLREEQARAGAN